MAEEEKVGRGVKRSEKDRVGETHMHTLADIQTWGKERKRKDNQR